MKKINLLIVCILITCFTFSQAYKPMLKENKTWETEYFDGNWGPPPYTSFTKWNINGDTIVDGNLYHKVFFSGVNVIMNDPINYSPISTFSGKLMREDSISRKIYGRQIMEVSESIIYDFSVNIGDTMRSILYGVTTPVPSNLGEAIVDSINPYILNNGDTTRIFYATPINFGVLTPTFFVIEGIGSHNGFYYPFKGVFEDDASLTCVKELSVQLYGNGVCGITVSSEQHLITLSFKIYPNPNNGEKIIVTGSSIKTLKLYNIQGQLIKTTEVLLKETILNLDNLPNGVYFINLQFKNEIILTEKLIITR